METGPVLWSPWEERNRRIFEGKELQGEGIVDLIKPRIMHWALARKGFQDFSTSNVMRNLGGSHGGWGKEKGSVVSWSPPNSSWVKFNVDRAVKRKKKRFCQYCRVLR